MLSEQDYSNRRVGPGRRDLSGRDTEHPTTSDPTVNPTISLNSTDSVTDRMIFGHDVRRTSTVGLGTSFW